MGSATVLVLVTVAIAGCGRGHSAAVDGQPADSAPLVIPMRIVVTDSSLEVYMEGADHGGCTCTPMSFPAPGSCTFATDANPCDGNPYCPSCITDVGLEVDGQRLTPTRGGGTDPWRDYYTSVPSDQLSLVVAGCGHPTTRISLDGPAFPQTTATADYVAGSPHVSWATDVQPLSTLLGLEGGLSGELCNVEGASEYTFTDATYGTDVEVEPLASRMDVDTAFGPATIWRAGLAWPRFPPPP